MTDFEQALQKLKGWGYDGVEFYVQHPLGFGPNKLKQVLAAADMKMVSFLTGWSYFNEGLCLCTPDESIRHQAIARLKEYIDVAAQFGSLLVIGQMQGFGNDEPHRPVALNRIWTCLEKLAHYAEDQNSTIVLEPVNHLQVGFNHTVEDVLNIIKKVGSPALKPMVDTLHMHIEEQSLIEAILATSGQLTHVHLCESNGNLFGSGSLDFNTVFTALKAINYDQFISVKIYQGDGLDSNAPAAIDFLRQNKAFQMTYSIPSRLVIDLP